MKKVIAVLVVLIASIVGASSAHAVNCHSFACLNRAVNKLQKQVKTDTTALAVLATCLNEMPVSDYGTPPSAGYVYDPGGGQATYHVSALDVTDQGDTVGAWVIYDKCNTTPTATAALSRFHIQRGVSVFSPIAHPVLSPFKAR
jgi:hypothetical protein